MPGPLCWRYLRGGFCLIPCSTISSFLISETPQLHGKMYHTHIVMYKIDCVDFLGDSHRRCCVYACTLPECAPYEPTFMLRGPRGDTHRSILLIQFASLKPAWKWRCVRRQVYSVIFMVSRRMGYTELDLWLTEFIELYSTRMYTRIHYWGDETENLQSI